LDKNRTNQDSSPPVLGLFQKRIEGDDALLALARLRFKEAGLGTEFYAETPTELEQLLLYKPTRETPAAVHLGRSLNLFSDESHDEVVEFARRFNAQVFGLVIHDQVEITKAFDDYLAALTRLAKRLKSIDNSPWIYVEYAAGLSPELFIDLFKSINGIHRIGCGVDIGHVGLWQARNTYAEGYPGEDVCALWPGHPKLPALIEDIQKAVGSAITGVIHVIRALGKIQTPVHFHLHDGHPLSTLSPFGISDHLSFFEKIDIPFTHKGKKQLNPMFGPQGLARLIGEAMRHLGPERISLSLEIHPTDKRLPLGEYGHLFGHWQDKNNAEQMNCWLSVLIKNYELVRKVLSSNDMRNRH
jgi:hypothetical protein